MTEPNPGFPSKDIKVESRERREYSKEFFDLQIKFARKVAEVSGRAFTDVLLDSTCIFKRLGIDGKPDPNNPIWQEFISGLQDKDLVDYTYKFYLRFKDQRIKNDVERLTFGCFRFDYKPTTRIIRIHFGNREVNGSPFANLEKRRQELKQMFEHIKQTYPDAKEVEGGSWLYNLSQYRNIFPPEYTAHPGEYGDGYRGLSMWGQFLDRNNNLRQEKVQEFLKTLDKANDEKEILQAFPLRPLSVKTDIENFYNFLKLN